MKNTDLIRHELPMTMRREFWFPPNVWLHVHILHSVLEVAQPYYLYCNFILKAMDRSATVNYDHL